MESVYLFLSQILTNAPAHLTQYYSFNCNMINNSARPGHGQHFCEGSAEQKI